jgi:DNA topoisomerase-1
LTTLRSRHVDVEGSTVVFEFRGKSGKVHRVAANDRRLARIVSRCTDLPGEVLFQFVDDDGALQPIESSHVNEYLRAIAGADITAKDFRTWAGTVLAAEELLSLTPPTKRNVVDAIKRVANRLGNTPAVCRRCYVHPEVVDAYLEGKLARSSKGGRLSGIERDVLALIQARARATASRRLAA